PTRGPSVANGVLISGVDGEEPTTRWFLDGWDPETGKKMWRTYTIPAPGEPGSETWPKNSHAWKYGGAPTWRSGSYDPELDLVYWGTGEIIEELRSPAAGYLFFSRYSGVVDVGAKAFALADEATSKWLSVAEGTV